MYIITGFFSDRIVRRVFTDLCDAIEFRDDLDAHYVRVLWETC